ncbi:hypothetical protein BT93_G1047 [Corymbia citriodora subsp. variegata]|nr:hypothetical protein BT93_G1047 [Corymbia citriodora subsp. variegata]
MFPIYVNIERIHLCPFPLEVLKSFQFALSGEEDIHMAPSSKCLFVLLLSLSPLVVMANSSPPSQHPLCTDHERLALLQFKQSFAIETSEFCDFSRIKSWGLEEESGDCCSWGGVHCNEDTGHVVGLDLSYGCLHGSLSPNSTLFSLVHLQELNLAKNHFNFSEIPSSLARLTKLKYLNFSKSFFSGKIPQEISMLSDLRSLDLSVDNISSVEHPSELTDPAFRSLIQNLSRLEELHLGWLTINSAIPDTIANLSSLRSLLLTDCGLRGDLPERIFHLPNLQSLDARYNQDLTGHFPEFPSGSPLQSLRLTGTSLSGQLPSSIGSLNLLGKLSIKDCHFSGSIPSSISNLTLLVVLDLSNNTLSGRIPSLENLTKLTYLTLDTNNFTTGSFQWIGRLSKLTTLDLSAIALNSEIPSSFANLSQISYLGLGFCHLRGHIPPWLMNLTHLTGLQLLYNDLEGLIPTSLSRLVNLRYLNLYSNMLNGTLSLDTLACLKQLSILHLSGNHIMLLHNSANTTLGKLTVLGLSKCNLNGIPNFLRSQDELEWMDLSYNGISGPVPRWFLSISRGTLQYLNISHNRLTEFEQQPKSFAWTRLHTIDLRFNMFRGPVLIPPASSLYFLLSNNKFTGKVPPMICNLYSLVALDLSYNRLSGMLPTCLGNISASLSILNLRSNNFQGPIPQNWTNARSLKMVDLSQNRLEGQVPRSLASCEMLEFLDLGDNLVNDTFPSWLGTSPRLSILILRSNAFHGPIGKPKTKSDFPKLRIIDLSHNQFTGGLPSEYFQHWEAMKLSDKKLLAYMEQSLMPTTVPIYTYYGDYDYSLSINNKGIQMVYMKILDVLTAVDLSTNQFEGEIPETIGNLIGLHALNLSHNVLTGRIPSSLGNIEALESLDLSQNKLTGQVPQQLTRLNSLALFNVSRNLLSGPIPKGGQFDTFLNTSYLENSGLCGRPISKECGDSASSPPSKEDEDSRFLLGLSWQAVVIGYGTGLFVGLVIGLAYDRPNVRSYYATQIQICFFLVA